MAYVALGPLGDGEFAYIFIALQMLPVVGAVYVVAFVLTRGTPRRGGQSDSD